MLVMRGDVFLDGFSEFSNAGEHAAVQALGRDVAEEALDHVQPRRGCRREMHCEARMFLQPLIDLEMFVGRVVVANQTQRFVFRRFALDLTQEIKPFSMAVALLAAGNDRAVQGIERSEQGGRNTLKQRAKSICSASQ
jgi:hypothetical protein